jgi:hypothetical protein
MQLWYLTGPRIALTVVFTVYNDRQGMDLLGLDHAV